MFAVEVGRPHRRGISDGVETGQWGEVLSQTIRHFTFLDLITRELYRLVYSSNYNVFRESGRSTRIVFDPFLIGVTIIHYKPVNLVQLDSESSVVV